MHLINFAQLRFYKVLDCVDWLFLQEMPTKFKAECVQLCAVCSLFCLWNAFTLGRKKKWKDVISLAIKYSGIFHSFRGSQESCSCTCPSLLPVVWVLWCPSGEKWYGDLGGVLHVLWDPSGQPCHGEERAFGGGVSSVLMRCCRMLVWAAGKDTIAPSLGVALRNNRQAYK